MVLIGPELSREHIVLGLKEVPMAMLRVVFKGYGKALQAQGGGVVVSAEDVLGAPVEADGPIKRDSWSGMAMLRRPE